MARLKAGRILISAISPITCRVISLIGEGGQGEVYSVDLNGQPYVLKWYNETVLRIDRGLRSRLRVAIDQGAPSAKFIWPFELMTLPDGSGLGYLMRWRKESYQEITELLAQRTRPTFRSLATTCCLITDALLTLHLKGLAYQDLNAGNVFFDADTGDIEICDNDNVDINGAPSVMGGVWEFQAPEVILRQSGPSRAADLHSLAVMLFRILHLGHPLKGRRELQFKNLDEAAQRRLYATEARFVFDPNDDSNRPVADVHGPVLAHWAIYPRFLRDLFTRAFTEGLYDPHHGRVQATEWRRAMNQLRDSVQTCGCDATNFYDAKRISAKESTFNCWSCGASLNAAPLRLGIRRVGARADEAPAHVVVLEEGAKLFAQHIGSGDYDFANALAEVTARPLRLRNLSGQTWTSVQEGVSATVGGGESVPLTPGMRINFGRADGDVKA